MISKILLLINPMLFLLAYSKHIMTNNINYPTSYTYVPPKSYICICTPSYLVGNIKNISDWDGECSNDQICSWNINELIIKTWYNP